MPDIRIGTASWTDKSLIDSGLFYPREAKSAAARLRYCATQFPIVEVDSSYYAMSSPEVSRLWAERTPDDFLFNVKAFRLFTGQTARLQVPKRTESSFRAALRSVDQKGFSRIDSRLYAQRHGRYC